MSIKKLEKRKVDLWSEIKQECGSSTIDLISELIEVNVELEKHRNQ